MLIYPQTSCFAKHIALLLEQGCGFRVWVLSPLLNAGMLCPVLSLVVVAHYGGERELSLGLSPRTGISQPESGGRQALVYGALAEDWAVRRKRICGKSGAHCAAQPVVDYLLLFIG